MSQHYPRPEDVLTIAYTNCWPSRSLKAIIERDGLIVPILVNQLSEDHFEAADRWQAERVIACIELGFETILVEDEWTEEDL